MPPRSGRQSGKAYRLLPDDTSFLNAEAPDDSGQTGPLMCKLFTAAKCYQRAHVSDGLTLDRYIVCNGNRFHQERYDTVHAFECVDSDASRYVVESTSGQLFRGATKGDRLSFLAPWTARRRKRLLTRLLSYQEPDSWSAADVCYRSNGNLGVDCKHTRRASGWMSPSGTAVELDLGVESFWSKMERRHMAGSCALVLVLGDSYAMPPTGGLPQLEGRLSTIELRFTTILHE